MTFMFGLWIGATAGFILAAILQIPDDDDDVVSALAAQPRADNGNDRTEFDLGQHDSEPIEPRCVIEASCDADPEQSRPARC